MWLGVPDVIYQNSCNTRMIVHSLNRLLKYIYNEKGGKLIIIIHIIQS